MSARPFSATGPKPGRFFTNVSWPRRSRPTSRRRSRGLGFFHVSARSPARSPRSTSAKRNPREPSGSKRAAEPRSWARRCARAHRGLAAVTTRAPIDVSAVAGCVIAPARRCRPRWRGRGAEREIVGRVTTSRASRRLASRTTTRSPRHDERRSSGELEQSRRCLSSTPDTQVARSSDDGGGSIAKPRAPANTKRSTWNGVMRRRATSTTTLTGFAARRAAGRRGSVPLSFPARVSVRSLRRRAALGGGAPEVDVVVGPSSLAARRN